MNSVSVKRIALWYLAFSLALVVLMLPFRTEIAAVAPSAIVTPPLWTLPIQHVVGIGLWVAFAVLWTNRPEGVFGR